MYNNECIIYESGKHVIMLEKDKEYPNYQEVDLTKATSNINVILPKIMLPSDIHMNRNAYALFTNINPVLIPISKEYENILGYSFEIEKPDKHIVKLPYRVGERKNNQMYEYFPKFYGYEAISPESDIEYSERTLYEEDDTPYITYKLYKNKVSVCVVTKDEVGFVPKQKILK